MQSSMAKKRTMSTAVTRSILPKIGPSPSTQSPSIFNRELFSQNASINLSKKVLTFDRKRIITEGVRSQRQRSNKSRLFPCFTRHIQKMLQPQINQILQMFRQINRLRQRNGVISFQEDSYDDFSSIGTRQIPYNPQLTEMNEEICELKRKIQQKIAKVFTMAKPYPKLKKMIQGILEQSSKQTLVQNNKVGKMGAMKAQHRLIVANRQQLSKLLSVDK